MSYVFFFSKNIVIRPLYFFLKKKKLDQAMGLSLSWTFLFLHSKTIPEKKSTYFLHDSKNIL